MRAFPLPAGLVYSGRMATQVQLTEEFNRFVAERVDDGRYGSANEVIRAAFDSLAREEQQDEAVSDEEKLQALRAAIAEGDASGIARGDVFAQIRRELGLPPERR